MIFVTKKLKKHISYLEQEVARLQKTEQIKRECENGTDKTAPNTTGIVIKDGKPNSRGYTVVLDGVEIENVSDHHLESDFSFPKLTLQISLDESYYLAKTIGLG